MKYKISKNISFRMLENEVVLLNLQNGYYYVLNKTASELWNLLFDSKMTIEKIINTLTQKYNTKQNAVQKDIEEQLDYWQKENIIFT